MAIKFLTTKKHAKTAKSITKIKEANKPIEVAKAEPKKAITKIGKREYNRALKIVNQYQQQNEIEKN